MFFSSITLIALQLVYRYMNVHCMSYDRSDFRVIRLRTLPLYATMYNEGSQSGRD